MHCSNFLIFLDDLMTCFALETTRFFYDFLGSPGAAGMALKDALVSWSGAQNWQNLAELHGLRMSSEPSGWKNQKHRHSKYKSKYIYIYIYAEIYLADMPNISQIYPKMIPKYGELGGISHICGPL